MFKNVSFRILLIILTVSIISIQSCGNKDDSVKKDSGKTGSSDLVKKDEKGQKANLKIAPKAGDKFRYKMTAKTVSKETSPATKDKEVTTEQLMTYYYSQEVADVNNDGVITFKMKYDSIIILSKGSAGGQEQSILYNSNRKDSISSKPDFIQYNALIGQEFRLRISPLGEIYDIFELEKIHDNIFKVFGDTLSNQDKQTIKESMGSDALKSVIQNQFQKFPGREVYKDSTWNFTVETNLIFFPAKNILDYKLTDIKEENGDFICTIEANLGIEFLSKEQKEKELTFKITDSQTGGKGTVVFNLSKGCIKKKETTTNITLDLKLSAKGQSAKSKQVLSTMLNVDLLQ